MLRYYKPKTIPFYKGVSPLYEQVENIIRSGSYTKGDYSNQLAEGIARLTGYRYAVPMGQGTHALFVLARWYWKHGYRKIRVPAFTWPSTYKPFEWFGYKVTFVDIDRETWLANFWDMPSEMDELRIPVDTFGSVFPSNGMQMIDSAQSLGAKWENKTPDRIVSLSGSKILTSGEGGILLTQNEELADFATNNSWFSRMPELSAALGLAYLDYFDDILKKKAEIAAVYRESFPDIEWQKIPSATNNYIVSGLVDSPKALAKMNPDWELRFYYDSIVNEDDERVPMEKIDAHLPNTDYVSRHIVAFPSWPDMPIERIKELRTP